MALQGILQPYLKEFNQRTGGELCSILFYSEYSQETQNTFCLALTLWVTINGHQSIWLCRHCFLVHVFTAL